MTGRKPRRTLLRKALQYLAIAALAAVGYWAIDRYVPDAVAWAEANGYVVENPEFAWLLGVIPVLLLIRVHTLSDLPILQQLLGVLFRSAAVVAVVLALVNIQKVEHEPIRTATVYAVDVSESVPDAMLDKARERIEQTWRAKKANVVRLVVFASRAQEIPLPEFKKDAVFPRLPRLTESDTEKGTDVQGALRLALALFPDDHLRRMVLMTDGLETQGDLEALETTANRFDIPIHYLDYTDVPRPGELMVTGLDAPESIKPNIPFKVKGTVEATLAQKATCELFIDGVLVETEEVQLEAGKRELEIETKVKEGGEKKLALACKGADERSDRFASNNRYEVPIKVAERPRILYIEGEKRYRKNLLTALSRDFEVEVRGARGVPSSDADAKAFDVIFISDVPRRGGMGYENMTTGQMKVLERYARAGGGLVLSGGENSLGPGGYGGSHLERKVLPVRLDVQKKEDIPSLALMLVIDRSGSMSGPKIELAKEAAKKTLEVLQHSDKLGVIQFDSNPRELVRLQRASNRLRITDLLSRLSPGGGTNIFPALDLGYQKLAEVRAKVKHMILLTDGQSNPTGILELVAQSYAEGITVSSVAVGMNSDQRLLMQIAEEGGGRYYYADNPANIPKIFLKETSEVTRRSLVEDRFRPKTAKKFARLQMFRGLNMSKVPALLGYVSTRAKRQAEVLMTSHLGEPILARWRLGLGKVMVWTSDVKNKWAHSWLKWPGYAKFWRQVLRDTARVEKEDPSFAMVTDVQDGMLRIGVDAVDDEDRFIDAIDSAVTIVDPQGQERQVTLAQTAAGRYEVEVPLSKYGAYTIRGQHTPKSDPDTTYRSFSTLAWPFPAEHLAGDPDLSAVMRLAAATGGIEAPTDALLFDPGDHKRETRDPMWPIPLYWVLGLLVLDVLVRRIRFWGKTSLSWQDVRGRA